MKTLGDNEHFRLRRRRQRTFGFSEETSAMLSRLCFIFDMSLTATMTRLIREEIERRGLLDEFHIRRSHEEK